MHEETFKIRMNPGSQTLRPVDFRVMFHLLTICSPARFTIRSATTASDSFFKPSHHVVYMKIHFLRNSRRLSINAHVPHPDIHYRNVSSAAARRPYDSGFLPYFESNVVLVTMQQAQSITEPLQ